jgi:hypothetical protein
MAGVPWYFDQERQAYRVRAGFRLAILPSAATTGQIDSTATPNPLKQVADQLLRDLEQFAATLRSFCESAPASTDPPQEAEEAALRPKLPVRRRRRQ